MRNFPNLVGILGIFVVGAILVQASANDGPIDKQGSGGFASCLIHAHGWQGGNLVGHRDHGFAGLGAVQADRARLPEDVNQAIPVSLTARRRSIQRLPPAAMASSVSP